MAPGVSQGSGAALSVTGTMITRGSASPMAPFLATLPPGRVRRRGRGKVRGKGRGRGMGRLWVRVWVRVRVRVRVWARFRIT